MHLLHGGAVRDGRVDVLVKRLDQDARAVTGEVGGDEALGVSQLQQAGLDADAAGEEVVTQLDDALLALVGGDQVGQHRPGSDLRAAVRRVGIDQRPRGQRQRDAGTRRADGTDRRGSGRSLERGDAVVIARVEVDDPGAGGDGVTPGGGELRRSTRDVRLAALAVERDLQERGAHGHRRSPPGRVWRPMVRASIGR